MSLRQMEYFLTVVEETSFTRAAELLHVTQPALSHQIKALERTVGGALLERLPRGVRLTPMGRAYLPHAERSVRSAAQARRAARAAAGAEGGELHIATVHAVAVGILPDVFARWRRAHPGVALVLHEYATPEALEEQLERGTADLAVGPPPAYWPGPVVPVGEEEIVLVVPFDDPLAGRASVRLQELADRPWVRCAMEPVVQGLPFLDLACGEAYHTLHGGAHRTHVDGGTDGGGRGRSRHGSGACRPGSGRRGLCGARRRPAVAAPTGGLLPGGTHGGHCRVHGTARRPPGRPAPVHRRAEASRPVHRRAGRTAPPSPVRPYADCATPPPVIPW